LGNGSDKQEGLDNSLCRGRPRIGIVERHAADDVANHNGGNDFVQLRDEKLIGFGDSEISLINQDKFFEIEPVRQDDCDFFIKVNIALCGEFMVIGEEDRPGLRVEQSRQPCDDRAMLAEDGDIVDCTENPLRGFFNRSYADRFAVFQHSPDPHFQG